VTNAFTGCEQAVGDKDFALVEQDLGVTLPEDFKNHYRQFNGGTPEKTVWIDPEGKWEENEVGSFLPLRYWKTKGNDPDFIIEGITRQDWAAGQLPRNLIPFATDWGGNYFCIDHVTGKIYFFVRDVWSDNLTNEQNLEANTRYVTSSLKEFVDGLELSEDE
jgi:hypothetical protein